MYILLGVNKVMLKIGFDMNKKLLFFLCTIMFFSYASEYIYDVLGQPFPCALDIFTTQNQRMYQEDRLTCCNIHQKGWLFGAMDGHSGDEVVEYVLQQLPHKFAQGLSNSLTEKQSFERAFAETEEDVLIKGFTSGSTALFVYITQDRVVHVAHAGDSRAVFGNKNGVVFATQDQTVYRDDERERVIQAGGIVYRDKSVNEKIEELWPWRINRLNMSRSIGDPCAKGKLPNIPVRTIPALRMRKTDEGKDVLVCLEQWPDILLENGMEFNPQIGQVIAEPEYTQRSLTDKDRWLIIATDGLWDRIKNEEAVKMVQDYYDEGGCLKGVAHYLGKCAIKKGSVDNIAVFVIDLLHVSNEKI